MTTGRINQVSYEMLCFDFINQCRQAFDCKFAIKLKGAYNFNPSFKSDQLICFLKIWVWLCSHPKNNPIDLLWQVFPKWCHQKGSKFKHVKFDFSKDHLRCQTFKLEPSTNFLGLLITLLLAKTSYNQFQPKFHRAKPSNIWTRQVMNRSHEQTTTSKGFPCAS